jgi:hypothetical protein
LAEYAGGHVAACHHPLSVSAEEVKAATRSPLSPLSSGDEMPSFNGRPSAPHPEAGRTEAATAAREVDDGGGHGA